MKRFAQLVILSLFYVATWAQPTQVGKYPPMVGEPKREDFPQEIDKQTIIKINKIYNIIYEYQIKNTRSG